jgi:hypothetical protein
VDNIEMDLLEIGWGGVDWIGLAQDRDKWRHEVAKCRRCVAIPSARPDACINLPPPPAASYFPKLPELFASNWTATPAEKFSTPPHPPPAPPPRR